MLVFISVITADIIFTAAYSYIPASVVDLTLCIFLCTPCVLACVVERERERGREREREGERCGDAEREFFEPVSVDGAAVASWTIPIDSG